VNPRYEQSGTSKTGRRRRRRRRPQRTFVVFELPAVARGAAAALLVGVLLFLLLIEGLHLLVFLICRLSGVPGAKLVVLTPRRRRTGHVAVAAAGTGRR